MYNGLGFEKTPSEFEVREQHYGDLRRKADD